MPRIMFPPCPDKDAASSYSPDFAMQELKLIDDWLRRGGYHGDFPFRPWIPIQLRMVNEWLCKCLRIPLRDFVFAEDAIYGLAHTITTRISSTLLVNEPPPQPWYTQRDGTLT